MKPTPGRIVTYRTIDGYDVAAVIVATDQTETACPMPALDSALHVHLQPFLPPNQLALEDADLINVPFADPATGLDVKRRSWRWPERVA